MCGWVGGASLHVHVGGEQEQFRLGMELSGRRYVCMGVVWWAGLAARSVQCITSHSVMSSEHGHCLEFHETHTHTAHAPLPRAMTSHAWPAPPR